MAEEPEMIPPTAMMSPELQRLMLARQEEVQALLVPTGPDAAEKRPYVTSLRGPKPRLVTLLRLSLWADEAKPFLPPEWDPVSFLLEHAPSIEALRSKQLVESVRMTRPPPSRWSIFGRDRE